MFEDDAFHVRRLGERVTITALFDFEAKQGEVGRGRQKARGFSLAPSTFGRSLGRISASIPQGLPLPAAGPG